MGSIKSKLIVDLLHVKNDVQLDCKAEERECTTLLIPSVKEFTTMAAKKY